MISEKSVPKKIKLEQNLKKNPQPKIENQIETWLTYFAIAHIEILPFQVLVYLVGPSKRLWSLIKTEVQYLG